MKDFWLKLLVALLSAAIVGAVKFSAHMSEEVSAIKTDVAVIKSQLGIRTVAQSTTQK